MGLQGGRRHRVPPTSGWTCANNCIKFSVSSSGALSPLGGSWHNRNACAGTSIDAMGVYVEYRHKSTIGMFFDDQLTQGDAIMQLKPVPSSTTCVSA